MNLVSVWENPERIDLFCELLTKIYEMRTKAKSELVREQSEKYLVKYSNELADLVLAVVDGKLNSNNINLSDAVRQNINLPNNLEGKVCQTLIKTFKVTLALKDKEKRIRSSILLMEALNHYLDIVIALIEGGEVDSITMNNNLNDIEARLRELLQSN